MEKKKTYAASDDKRNLWARSKKKSSHIYIYTIHISEVASRSVNSFIKSVFVVVTTAKKNYFSLFSPHARVFFFSFYSTISLFVYLNLSLTPILHVVDVFFLLLFLLLFFLADRRAPTVRRRNIISPGLGDSVWAVAGVPRMCARRCSASG